jgi:hypothetical protein
MLLMSADQRAYVAQMTFVLQSYEGREPETSNLSRHLYHYVNGYPEAPDHVLLKTSLIKKPVEKPISKPDPQVKKKG